MDMSEYMDTYREEVQSNITEAETLLPNIEKEYSKEDIEGLRRNAHTIKSSSAMMGFPMLSELCKGTEFLLKKVLGEEITFDDSLRLFVKNAFSNIKEVGLSVNHPGDDESKVDSELLEQARKFI
jgi:chemotaxis protein histidine kinase CheA